MIFIVYKRIYVIVLRQYDSVQLHYISMLSAPFAQGALLLIGSQAHAGLLQLSEQLVRRTYKQLGIEIN